MSGLLIVQFLPTVFAGPWNGKLADRFDRQVVLVTADVLRVLVRETGTLSMTLQKSPTEAPATIALSA